MGHIAAFANATIGPGLTKAYSGVCKMLLMLHRISRLNASTSTSVDYEWWRKAYKTNIKSEKGSE